MKKLTLGSLFDGSGGFPLGGVLCGIEPKWKSEIEPFAIAVTNKHFPEVKHYGDVSKIDGGEVEPVDIITFGSPCQDLSVAGKRAGLENGERSNLFYQAIRIIKEMRSKTNGEYPRFIVWENVPGAFSSNKGQDFRSVLEAVCSVKEPEILIPEPTDGKWTYAGEIVGNGYSLAWRTIDAQYFGVPQRRRRIYLVADFGSECAGKILFESEGVSRDFAESGDTREGTAGGAETCARATGFDGYNGSVTGEVETTLGVNCGMSSGRNGVVLNDQGGSRMGVTKDKVAALRAEAHHPPCVMAAGFNTEHSAQSRSIGYEEETSPTIRAGKVPAAVALNNHPADSRVGIAEEGKAQTLTSRMGTGGGNVPLVLNEEQTDNELPEVYENHSQDTRYRGPLKVAPTVASTYGMGGNNQPFVVDSENRKNSVPILMKIRSGCEGGGKGPLIQKDKSATLACNNDQTLFEPCNWDGGQISPTLTKQNAGGNQRMPDKDNFNCVIQRTFGICAKDSNSMKSSNPNSGIYEAETSRTLDGNGGNPACNQGGIAVVEEHVPSEDCEEVYAVDQGGGKSACNVSKNQAPTLTCTHGGEPAVYCMTTGSYTDVEKEKSPTLMARDYKDPNVINAPSYGVGRDAFNQGTNAKFKPSFEEELEPPLLAKGPGAVVEPYGFDPSASRDVGRYVLKNKGNTVLNGTCPGYHNGMVGADYSVRRLTPTECAKLQGFPSDWCCNLGIAEPMEEEIEFWTEVFETYRLTTGSAIKPKTRSQIISYIKDPYSDAAEYKLWGNGVALPCVKYVLGAIAKLYEKEA